MYPQPRAAVQLVTLLGVHFVLVLAFMMKTLRETVRSCTHQLQFSKYGLRGEPVAFPELEPIRLNMPQPPGGPASISIVRPPWLPLLTSDFAAAVSVHEVLLAHEAMVSPSGKMPGTTSPL